MRELKHVGRAKATNKKCIVAYRTLPGDAYSCLIIPTESLPDAYHDALLNLVESNTGQSAYEFAEALTRTSFSDGSIMLAALHTQKRLLKVPTDQIEMLPRPGIAILLAELNQIIAEQKGVAVDDLALKQADVAKTAQTATVEELPTTISDDVGKTTSASVNQTEAEVVAPTAQLSPAEQVLQYRADAARLADEAAALIKLAESLEPAKAKPAVASKPKATVKKPTSVVKKAPAVKKPTKASPKV